MYESEATDIEITEEDLDAFVDSCGDWYDRHLNSGRRNLIKFTSNAAPSTYNPATQTWTVFTPDLLKRGNDVVARRAWDGQNLRYTLSRLYLHSTIEHLSGGIIQTEEHVLLFDFDENSWSLEIKNALTVLFQLCATEFDYALPLPIRALEFNATNVSDLVNLINNWPWKCIL